jgi:DNA polymerase beta
MSQIVNEQIQLVKEKKEKKHHKPRVTKKKMPEKSQDEIIYRNTEPMNEKLLELMVNLTALMAKRGDKIRANTYKRAQETILSYPKPILNVNQLLGEPGIGPGIMKKLKEYQETGTLELLEKEKNKPEYILSNVYGIGPIKAKELVEKYGIKSIEELRERQEEVLNVVQKIGLKYYEEIEQKIPRAEIDEYNNIFANVFSTVHEDVSAYEIVGSYRRKMPESSDIDVIITAENPSAFENFINMLIEKKIITNVLSYGKTKALVVAKIPTSNIHRRVDFLYTKQDEYPFAILYFTGSKGFNTAMRLHALKLGYTLNEHGLTKIVHNKKTEKVEKIFINEHDIFNFLGLEYKKPEERTDGRAVVPKSIPKMQEPTKIIDNMDFMKTDFLKTISKEDLGEPSSQKITDEIQESSLKSIVTEPEKQKSRKSKKNKSQYKQSITKKSNK